MGLVLPLRFGGGGVRALVAPMVACVSSVYSYRTATASKGQRIRVIPSTRWRGAALAADAQQAVGASLHTHQPCREDYGKSPRSARSREEGLGAGAEGCGDAFPGELSVALEYETH